MPEERLTDAVHARVVGLVAAVAHTPVRAQRVDTPAVLAQARDSAALVNVWKPSQTGGSHRSVTALCELSSVTVTWADTSL